MSGKGSAPVPPARSGAPLLPTTNFCLNGAIPLMRPTYPPPATPARSLAARSSWPRPQRASRRPACLTESLYSTVTIATAPARARTTGCAPPAALLLLLLLRRNGRTRGRVRGRGIRSSRFLVRCVLRCRLGVHECLAAARSLPTCPPPPPHRWRAQLVSCEMIEAVGQEHMDAYFRMLGAMLRPGGRAAIQARRGDGSGWVGGWVGGRGTKRVAACQASCRRDAQRHPCPPSVAGPAAAAPSPQLPRALPHRRPPPPPPRARTMHYTCR